MGFITGFTGGVTLTLSLACLGVLAHQRNRQAQSESLRAQAYLLDTLSTPAGPPGQRILPPPPLSRPERAAEARATLVEQAKDRWNAEVESAARWAQSGGLTQAAEGLEGAVGRAWTRAFGGGVDAGIEKAADAVADSAAAAGGAAEASAADLSDKTKEAVLSLVNKAKAAVGVAQDRVVEAAAGSASAVTTATAGTSSVEKALRQRYESREEAFNRSAAEILNERYTPIDKRDNTVLRGL